MSETKGNGHDPVTIEMVGLLKEIRDEIKGVRADLTETNGRLDALREETNARLDALKTVTENAHRHLHERIDEAHAEAATNTQERTGRPGGILARLERLEEAVFKRTGT